MQPLYMHRAFLSRCHGVGRRYLDTMAQHDVVAFG